MKKNPASSNSQSSASFFRSSRLMSIFIPTLLWGDILETEASTTTQRFYRPTQAQQRLLQQQREQEQRIQLLRRQQALQKKKTPEIQRNKKTPQTPAEKTLSAPLTATGKAATHNKIRYITYQKRRFVLLQDVAKYYGMKITYQTKGIQLKSSRDTVELQYKKRIANVNKTNMYLTHAPLVRGALVYLDENDFFLVIDPVIRNAPLWKHSIKTILVDAGHGGKDQGAPGVNKLLEKNITLQMANKLAAQLRKSGYKVLMTRTGDTTLTLQQRADLCEKYKPHLFISIHCNAVKNKKTSGVETFAMTPRGAASTSDKKPGKSTGPGNSYDKNNYRLAYEVQKKLIQVTKSPDRGVKHARFFVLRKAICPGILVETGFITHPKEGVNLSKSAYQDKIISGIVSGINAYVNAAKLRPDPKRALKKK